MNLYITTTEYAYEGVYTHIPKLPGHYVDLELDLTIIGAALVDMIEHKNYRKVQIHTSKQALIDLWNNPRVYSKSGALMSRIKEKIKKSYAIVNMVYSSLDEITAAINKEKHHL